MTADPNVESSEPRDEVDLSAAAIYQRLDEVGQLHELGMYLAQAKLLSRSEPHVRVDSSDE